MARNLTNHILAVGLLAGGVVAFSPLSGCRKHSSQVASEVDEGLIADFTVRGRVVDLPDPARPASDFKVYHEPIPSWKRNHNQPPVGMNAMQMPFPPATPEVIEGVSVGDIVEIVFRVSYDADDGSLKGWKAIRVTQLPADTALVFDKPAPAPAPAPAPE
ncbi:MAG: copper-binding protein [Phycisphaeraceae bacterium]|nr:copper-binding protein [Phycisphaeraceae bacterium]